MLLYTHTLDFEYSLTTVLCGLFSPTRVALYGMSLPASLEYSTKPGVSPQDLRADAGCTESSPLTTYPLTPCNPRVAQPQWL